VVLTVFRSATTRFLISTNRAGFDPSFFLFPSSNETREHVILSEARGTRA